MRRPFSGILLILLLASVLPMAFGTGATGVPELSFEEPVARILDFKNGTKEIIIDYRNGTQNCISETFLKKTGQLLATSNETDPSMTALLSGVSTSGANPDVMSLTLMDRPTKYTNTTQTVNLTQTMMLGFTYTLAYWQQQWSTEGEWWVFTWYLAVGVDIDIRFGLRLPMNVTIEYPEQMIIGNNYTIHATLDPVDLPDFNESLCTFKANIWAQADICVPGLRINLPRTVLFGPNIDDSRSFMTPLGSDSAPFFYRVELDILALAETIITGISHDNSDEVGSDMLSVIRLIKLVVSPKLVVQPTFGSNLITAKANALWDAHVVEGSDLSWSEPHQTVDFLVSADEYDPRTNYSKLVISDFRYYFTEFGADFSLLFDFHELINFFLGIPDPEIFLFRLNLSWITDIFGAPCVTSHAGYPGSVDALVYVDRIPPVPPPPPPQDVALTYAYIPYSILPVFPIHPTFALSYLSFSSPSRVYAGEVVNIKVGAQNLGSMSATFNVTIYANSSVVDRQLVADLLAGDEVRLDFAWNTTGFPPWHVYNITAEASEVPNEINKDNNFLSAGIVEIVLSPPRANFTYSPTTPIVNQTVTFDATGSVPGHGTIVSYIWDFGEGDNLTTANPVVTYVFASDGIYNVTLTLENSGGLTDTVREFVKVNQEEGHDVAIIDVIPYRDWVYQGQPLNINVTVVNRGNFTETVEVRVYYYNLAANGTIGIEATSLNPGENVILTFTWNTSEVPYCHNYTIIAIAGISHDINPADNMRESYVKVRIPGDVNGDGTVHMLDLSAAAASTWSYPGHPRWNPDADQNGDNKVNIIDLTLIAIHWKLTC